VDCDAVVETKRGHNLGRVIWEGQTEPDTGTPGRVAGREAERVIRAPADGAVTPHAGICDILHEGDLIASVGGAEVRAPFDGVLRGLIHESVQVTAGLKIGDLDPRARPDYCVTISDKALAVGGGVLEAVLASPVIREKLVA
jgi:xanthine dehydrogenase accessory factor